MVSVTTSARMPLDTHSVYILSPCTHILSGLFIYLFFSSGVETLQLEVTLRNHISTREPGGWGGQEGGEC